MLGGLLLPLAMPGAVAWRADGWLSQDVVGGERLRLGDEFGCHGMPGKDLNTDISVIAECKEYLTSQINASKWGPEPLSFGLPEGVIEFETMEALRESNFLIVSGNELQSPSNIPLENLTEAPEIIEQSGGSLEKNIASADDIHAGIDEHGYANLYWEAQLEDLNVRRDKDVLSWIESQDFWFTTWGEFYSAGVEPADPGPSQTQTDPSQPLADGLFLIGTAPPSGGWSVPGTTNVTVNGANITLVERVDQNPIPVLDPSDHHLQVGYRIIENQTVFLTIPEGVEVRISFDQHPEDIAIRGDYFNGLTPFMVTGHHTTDLFEWSSPFQDSPLRFTWLIEPQPDVEPSWILPMLAVLTILAAPVAVRYTLNHDREMHHSAEEE